MTMVKTKAVTSARHAANLAAYIDDERAVMREGHNIACEERWAHEMATTREAYGHDVPARAGGKNTILYHQVIAFLPDDCSMHGGSMTAEACMAYARAWCEREYPDQEVMIALHRERAESDGTERWAAHLAVNRTDLETGLRYNPGLGHVAAAHRARLAREMDAERGLTPTHRGRVSRVHERQAPQPVREMRARGETPWRDVLAEAVRDAASRAESMDELSTLLASEGVTVRTRGRREISYQLEGHNPVRGSRLGGGTDRETVEAGLALNAALARCERAADALAQAGVRLEDARCALWDAQHDARVDALRARLRDLDRARDAASQARGVARLTAKRAVKEAETALDAYGGESAAKDTLLDAENGVSLARGAEQAAMRELDRCARAYGVAAHDAGQKMRRDVLDSMPDDVRTHVARLGQEAHTARARSVAEQARRELERQRPRARQIDHGLEMDL